jgi:Xaa-Pro aminopeptidase
MPTSRRIRRVNVPALYASRLDALRAALRERKLDGLLLTNRMDQYWLTGFTGEDGAVLITADRVMLLTDGRFQETARLEAPWAEAVIRKTRGPDTIGDAARRRKLRRLGFDPNQLTVATHAGVRKSAPSCRLVPAAGLVSELRQIKSAEELAIIRRAIAIAESAFKAVRPRMKAGVTEREIALRLVREMQDRGATGPAFAPIVASGPHAALPHYASADAPIVQNQVLLIDWGARYQWYVSDLTRCVPIGTVPPRVRQIHKVADQARRAAIAAAKPGLTAGKLDRVARDWIRKAGFGPAFSHSLGHGIGLDVHEGPGLRSKSEVVLRPDMVVTIEPGIYLPGVGGVRIEDDVRITSDGAEVLSSLPVEEL